MLKYFITSDVHSFYNEMMEALNKQQFDINNNDHILCIAGDAFDRGSQSKEMLQFMKFLGDRLIYVRGNHEDLLFDCVRDIVSGKTIGSHHFSNGTVKTIEQLCGLKENELWFPRRSDSLNRTIYEKMKPIIEWINEKSVNYAEMGDNIFVHGWIPVIGDGVDFMGNWRNPRPAPREWWDNGSEELWNEARWVNGMDMWKKGVRIPDKTIICGHWHSSAAHYYLHGVGSEWGDDACFDVFIDDGICMLDACTVVSHKVNVVVLEV